MARESRPDNTCGPTFPVTPMRHRGLTGWKYDCRCNYMVTLVTSPRQGLFGTLREWGVERSLEGRAVYDAWQGLGARFPAVQASYYVVMPDHFHGIVYVTRDGAADLADVVSAFAGAVERRIGRPVWNPLWRDSVCLARGQLHRQIHYVLSNPVRRWIKERNPWLFRKVMGFRHGRLERAQTALREAGGPDTWNYRAFAFRPPTHGSEAEFWDPLTGEEIAKPRKGNRLQRAFGEPGLPAVQRNADDKKDGPVWTALGNPFLLDEPCLVSVRISTLTPPARLERLQAAILAKVSRGAVLVGAWISPGEKTVKAAALAAGGRIVQLLPEGMGPYYKPWGLDFGFCAEGRMLQLSPFAPPARGAVVRTHPGKARFEWLNVAARAMGDLALGVARADLVGG